MSDLLRTVRVRFNWGFHDAKADREANRRNRAYIAEGVLFSLPSKTKLDRAYRAGYLAAQTGAFDDETTSDRAFAESALKDDTPKRYRSA
jgi:hypothetical protein